MTSVAKPYPGYNPGSEVETPRPNARVKPEAEEYASKGRGSLCLFTSRPQYVEQPMPEPKCPSNEARRNYDVGRNGTVNALLYGQATPRNDVHVARVSMTGQPIADAHQGKQTASLFNSYGNLPLDSPGRPRVKQEANETAEQHKGGRMNNLLHDPSKLPNSARAVPRVKNEAAANAELDRGGQINKNLHSYGSMSSRPDYVPRVKPEAQEIAEKSKGYMGTLMGKYGKLPTDSQPPPKVGVLGTENANLDKGGRMSRLMHEGDRLPSDPKPPPRASSKTAKHNLKAGRGQMGKILAAQGRMYNVPSVGR